MSRLHGLSVYNLDFKCVSITLVIGQMVEMAWIAVMGGCVIPIPVSVCDIQLEFDKNYGIVIKGVICQPENQPVHTEQIALQFIRPIRLRSARASPRALVNSEWVR